jgi:hypothetical protein
MGGCRKKEERLLVQSLELGTENFNFLMKKVFVNGNLSDF